MRQDGVAGNGPTGDVVELLGQTACTVSCEVLLGGAGTRGGGHPGRFPFAATASGRHRPDLECGGVLTRTVTATVGREMGSLATVS